jgi:hypothetical protein
MFMKIVRLILVVALLSQTFFGIVQATTQLEGASVVPERLVKDYFAEVKYRDHKNKVKTARGFIKNIEKETFHIRNGLWKVDIAYRDVVVIVMAPQSQDVDRFLKQTVEHKDCFKDIARAIKRLKKKTVIQMAGDQIDRSELKENRYVVVNYIQDEQPMVAFGRIRGFGGQGLIVKGDREWRIPYDAIEALTLSDNKGDIKQFQQKGAVYDAKVLVTAPDMWSKRIWGRVEQVRGDTLVVRQFQDKSRLFVPVSKIEKLEVSVGMRSATGKGMMVGLGIGSAIMTLGIVSAARDDSELAGLQVYVALVLAVPVLGICTLLGAMSRSDHWVEIPTNRIDLGIRPVSPQGPPQAVFTIRF